MKQSRIKGLLADSHTAVQLEKTLNKKVQKNEEKKRRSKTNLTKYKETN